MPENWPAWRGGVQEGRSADPSLPLHWGPDHNIEWRVRIPGEGHSSPIVSGNAVYVTTAREIPVDRPLLVASRCALWIGCVLLAAITVGYIVRACAATGGTQRARPGPARLACLCVLVTALCLLVLLGESVFDFGSAPERGWLAGCLAAALALTIAADSDHKGTRAPLLAGVGLVSLAGLAAATVPDWAHTAGPGAPRGVATFIWASVALPLLAGAGTLAAYARAKAGSAGDRRSSRQWRAAAGLLAAAAWAGAVIVVALLAGVVAGSNASTASTVTTHAAYQPVFPVWLPAIALAAALVLLWLATGRFLGRLLAIGALAAGGLLAAAVCVEQLLARVRYLAYLAGSPKVAPILGWWSSALVAGFGGPALVWTTYQVMRRPPAAAAGFPRLLRGVALAVGGLYLIYAQFIPKAPYLDRGIVCVDRTTGRIRWIAGAVHGPRTTMNNLNSPATPTPVTDGQSIYAYFGTPGLVCLDKDGRRQWLNRDLPFDSREGVASSPVMCGDNIVVLSESDAGAYLAAVDRRSGRLAWRTERRQKVHGYAGNCRTPTIIRTDGHEKIVVWGMEDCSGYDAVSGRELWSCDVGDMGAGDNPVSSALSDGNRIYLVGLTRFLCLEVGRLHLGSAAPEWERRIADGPQCSTPTADNGLVFAVSDGGSLHCYDAHDGREVWRVNLVSQHYASPIAAAGRVYICDTRGRTAVIASARQFRRLAENSLPGRTFASFAPAGGRLYIRAGDSLYAIHEVP